MSDSEFIQSYYTGGVYTDASVAAGRAAATHGHELVPPQSNESMNDYWNRAQAYHDQENS